MDNMTIGLFVLSGAILILAGVLYKLHQQRVQVREQVARERAEREKNEQSRKLKKQQNEIGENLFKILSKAASQNLLVNMLPEGRKGRGVGMIEIERIQDNGGSYNIFVSIPDPSCLTLGGLRKAGYALMQISINMEKDCIYIFKGPYGPSADYKVKDIYLVCEKLGFWIESFKLYQECPDFAEVFQVVK